MGEALTIEVRQGHGYAIMTAAGEIDISTVTRLRERLFDIAASGHPLVVDFDHVGFIDSVGLAVLVGTANRAAAHGGSLQVACAPPKIRELLRLAGLDRRIALPGTMDEALEALTDARATS
jgi:anti-sigma B factor antagonist